MELYYYNIMENKFIIIIIILIIGFPVYYYILNSILLHAIFKVNTTKDRVKIEDNNNPVMNNNFNNTSNYIKISRDLTCVDVTMLYTSRYMIYIFLVYCLCLL